MVLRIVRYLAQNGYGLEKLFVLTLYLGQLYNLQDVLRSENDTVLNDLDSFDLVRGWRDFGKPRSGPRTDQLIFIGDHKSASLFSLL